MIDRDLEREAYNEFDEYGYDIEDIIDDPRLVMQDLMGWLQDRPDAHIHQRDRWQYTIGLCQQVLRGRTPCI